MYVLNTEYGTLNLHLFISNTQFFVKKTQFYSGSSVPNKWERELVIKM